MKSKLLKKFNKMTRLIFPIPQNEILITKIYNGQYNFRKYYKATIDVKSF